MSFYIITGKHEPFALGTRSGVRIRPYPYETAQAAHNVASANTYCRQYGYVVVEVDATGIVSAQARPLRG